MQETTAILILFKSTALVFKNTKKYFIDVVLLIIGFVFMIVGIFGSFLLVLLGRSISWSWLVALYFTNGVRVNYWILSMTLLVTVIISILDYVISAKGTKKFGGNFYGIWGNKYLINSRDFCTISFRIYH